LANPIETPELDRHSESYFLGSEFGVFFDGAATLISANLDCHAQCRLIEVNRDRIFLQTPDDVSSVCAPGGARFFLVFQGRIFDCTHFSLHEGLLVAHWSRIYFVSGVSRDPQKAIPLAYAEPESRDCRSC